MTTSNRNIIDLIRRDRQTTFDHLYAEYYGMVEFLVRQNSGNVEDARDVFQDCLIVIYEKSLDAKWQINCDMKTYIYSICRNLWLKELRSRKRKMQLKDYEQYIEVTVEQLIEEEEEDDSALAAMTAAMKRLGDKCKQILLAYYYQKKRMDEIAKELNYTNADNVKNQKYKCMRSLKRMALAG